MKLNRDSTKYLQIIMLALCIVFTGDLIYELNRNYTLSATNEDAVTSIGNTSFNRRKTTPSRPVSDYSVIIERPLFTEDRRPDISAGEPVSTPTADANRNNILNGGNDHLLSAVIITENNRMALLRSGRDNSYKKLGIGEVIDGWTLASIEAHEITINRGTETRTLKLKEIK